MTLTPRRYSAVSIPANGTTSGPLAHPGESLAAVARRLEIVSRVIVAEERTREGSDRSELLGLLRALEDELITALQQNEQERAA